MSRLLFRNCQTYRDPNDTPNCSNYQNVPNDLLVQPNYTLVDNDNLVPKDGRPPVWRREFFLVVAEQPPKHC